MTEPKTSVNAKFLADELREDYPAVDVTAVVFSNGFAGIGCCVIPQERVIVIADEITRLAAELAAARKALEECLGEMGWTNYTDAEMTHEAALGNGMAPIILRARAALQGQPK